MKFDVGKYPSLRSKYEPLAEAILSLPVDGDEAVRVTEITEQEAKNIKTYFQGGGITNKGYHYRQKLSNKDARVAIQTKVDSDTGQIILICRVVSKNRGKIRG